VKEIDATGRERPVITPHTPFVLWDCQRVAASEIIAGVRDGRDVVVRKTRDMGASWLLSAIAVWGWMFHGWQSLLVSRVEDLVDRTGDPDSLFWKVDYLIASQPEWLLPAKPERFAKGGEWRQHMMLRHPESGATIAGQASTEHIGRGGRRTLILTSSQRSTTPTLRGARLLTARRVASRAARPSAREPSTRGW